MIPPRALVSRAERRLYVPRACYVPVASQSVTRSDRALLWSMPRQAFSAVAEITAVRSDELLAVTSNCALLQ
jgi:hypothetical protein